MEKQGLGEYQRLHDETVADSHARAVIEAYGNGEIELETVDPKARKDTIHVLPGGNTYDLTSVARFLGWIKQSNRQSTDFCVESTQQSQF